jgi:hypothetical protein
MKRRPYLYAWLAVVGCAAIAYLPAGRPPVWVLDAAFYSALALYLHRSFSQ